MFFKETDGAECWKLIDFDAACSANSSDYVKIKMDYSAPEVIRAHNNGENIKASFEMDIFSFGLILYFLETGISLKEFFLFIECAVNLVIL